MRAEAGQLTVTPFDGEPAAEGSGPGWSTSCWTCRCKGGGRDTLTLKGGKAELSAREVTLEATTTMCARSGCMTVRNAAMQMGLLAGAGAGKRHQVRWHRRWDGWGYGRASGNSNGRGQGREVWQNVW